MEMVLPFLLILAGLGPIMTARRVRAGKLARLRALVGATRKRSWGTALSQRLTVDRILPPSLLRNLRLLGLEPDLGGVAVALAAVLALTGAAALLVGVLAALAFSAAALTVGLVTLGILAARRLAELGSQLPGFFDRVRQLLIVGNSLPTSFQRSVQGAPPRLKHFFAPSLRRMGNGASFSESIAQSVDDIDLYEMRLFAAAVATNMRFGGSLTHSLGNLIAYLRKRASMERELRASTTQIRFSAWVLGLLPLIVAGLVVFQNQDYARWFISHPMGKRMLVYCVFSQIAGALMMRLVVRTRF